MISPVEFYSLLEQHQFHFFTGVPDSLLKEFCACVADRTPSSRHIIAANEGSAVALAAGYHLATGGYPVVYMQNSGLGNAVNPLVSLVDPEVYRIPLLMMIGWRGEPSRPDEPQHVKQGRITRRMLETLEIPFSILDDTTGNLAEIVRAACDHLKHQGAPYAFVCRIGTFAPYALGSAVDTSLSLLREEALAILLDNLKNSDIVISTTGKTSRELFELREKRGEGHERDFLTVGSMGHASQIALAIALQITDRRVICVDGDGAALMHMGGFGIIGSKNPENLYHVLINNGAHESVGGQPTVGFEVDFGRIAAACGYVSTDSAASEEALKSLLPRFLETKGPALLEIRVRKGSRKNLGRPTTSPLENKQAFMEKLRR